MKHFLNHKYLENLKNQNQEILIGFFEEISKEASDIKIDSLFENIKLEEILKISADKNLFQFDAHNFYLANLLDKFIFIIQLHKDLHEGNDPEGIITEEIFTFWNESDLALPFSELLNSNEIIDSSKKLVEIYYDNILSFYKIHINRKYLLSPREYHYVPIPEFGDSITCLYIEKGTSRAEWDMESLPPYLLLSFNDSEIQLHNERITKIEIKENKYPSISLEQRKVDFIFPKNLDESIINKIQKDTSTALSHIYEADKELGDFFFSFTKIILPINESGVVSFSLQSIPGHSCINYFERDFVDLIDDLIHENGHHFLNFVLNTTELINEDDENVFYSPWRETNRPVRGLFHATLTFAWAYYLFLALSKWKDLSKHLSEDQIEKIHFRLIEEELMIFACREQCSKAHSLEKITDDGIALTNELFNYMEKQKDFTAAISNGLNNISSEKIDRLNRKLEEKVKETLSFL